MAWPDGHLETFEGKVFGFIDKPRGVRIRYKLLQATGAPGNKPAKGAGGETDTHFCDPIGHVQVSGD